VNGLRHTTRVDFPGLLLDPKADAAELAAVQSLRIWAKNVAAH
jgi:hypothetical protein